MKKKHIPIVHLSEANEIFVEDSELFKPLPEKALIFFNQNHYDLLELDEQTLKKSIPLNLVSDEEEKKPEPQSQEPFIMNLVGKEGIRKSDLSEAIIRDNRLEPEGWYNDTLLDFSLNYYLQSLPKEFQKKIFLLGTSHTAKLRYKRPLNIFLEDNPKVIIFPWNFQQNHWILIITWFHSCIDPDRQGTILVLDSLNKSKNEEKYQKETNAIRSFARYHFGEDNDFYQETNLPVVIPSVPQQSDGWNCGVFVSVFFRKFIETYRAGVELVPPEKRRRSHGFEQIENWKTDLEFSIDSINQERKETRARCDKYLQ
jgi:Ulp1 family protease